MKKCLSLFTFIIVFSFVSFFTFGCGSDSPSAPLSAFSPEIFNTQDSFQFQVTNAQNVNTTVQYNWLNSGTRATINHSSTITSGSSTVSIYDNVDSLVYTSALLASANEPSVVGIAGTWRIQVVFTNCNGTINFRVEKL